MDFFLKIKTIPFNLIKKEKEFGLNRKFHIFQIAEKPVDFTIKMFKQVFFIKKLGEK